MTRVRYYCHAGEESGYGVAASEMAMAMLGAGLDLEICTTGTRLHNRYLPLAPFIRSDSEFTESPDVVIVHTMPMSCSQVMEKARIRELHPNAVCIAYTTWEGATPISIPVEASLRVFDYVWVPSASCRSRMQPVLGDDVTKVVPHAYDEAMFGEVVVRNGAAGMGSDGRGYRFYYIGAWNSRKNPEGVIRAFRRAFSPGDDVSLTLHCPHAWPGAARIAALATGMHDENQPKIELSTEWISDDAVRAIHLKGDCFVTASRGEAWNLPAFEAMLYRNHVIAPFGQGSDEFLKRTSAELYPCRMTSYCGDARFETTPPDAPPGQARVRYYGAQGMTVRDDWWDPDVAQLSLAMRRAYVEVITSLRLEYNPAERFGRKAIGELIVSLLKKAKRTV